MTNFKISFTAFLYLLMMNCSYCQNRYYPGYIITYRNDTLYGYIDLRSNFLNSQSCKFVKNPDETPVIYSPEDIKAYKLDNSKYYVSRVVNIDQSSKRVFLEYLVDGIVDLYYLKNLDSYNYFIQSDTSLIMLSNDDKLYKDETTGSNYLVSSDQYKKIMRYIFSDSPITMQKLNNTSFDYNSLIKITVNYHNNICNEYECIDYSRLTNQKIVAEVNAGIISSWMGLKTSNDYAFNSFPFIGFNIRISPPRIFERWNLLIGLSYSQNNFHESYKNMLFTGSLKTYEIYCKYDIVRLPLAFEYTFPTKIIKPFLSVGFNNILIIDPDYYVNYETMFSGKGAVFSEFRKYQFGLAGGLGLKYEFENKNFLYFKNEFEFRKPLANFRHVLDYHYVNSLFFKLGYGFRI